MDEFYFNEIEVNREMNKLSLDTFHFDKHNILDSPIDKSINNLKKQLKECCTKYTEINNLSINNPKEFRRLNKKVKNTEHDLSLQMYDYLQMAIYLKDELFALYEIKIIYAYKHLEINLKNLISKSYNDKSVNKQFNWEKLNQYMLLKNINLKDIEYYNEINDLRELNNVLKHSTELNQDFTKIDEFKNIKQITYQELEKFYNRVKKTPIDFLSSLSGKIYNDIYEFDEKKIKDMAEKLALRMNKETAKKLSETIMGFYD